MLINGQWHDSQLPLSMTNIQNLHQIILNMDVPKLFNTLLTYVNSVDLQELSDLDMACKSILVPIIENPTTLEPSFTFKIQSVLDYTYEKINIGNWKEVQPYLRKTMAVASYLKLLAHFKINENSTETDNLLGDAYKIIDYGLLFGCPLTKNPTLLQNCASELNKFHISTNKPALGMEKGTIQNVVPQSINKSNAKEIESIDCPSMEYFYSNYISKEKPVILNNCIDHWPALSKWKDETYLLKLAGLRTVPVELGTKYTDAEWTQKLMTLEDFIQNHIYKSNNTTGYLAQYQLFNQIPELRDDITEPEYCCFADTDEGVDINAWYGPKGTVSPLHHDQKKNLLAQVVGQKSIFLYSPLDSKFVYPHDEELLCNTAQIDPREPNLEKYPEYSKASPLHCVLNPGQILYIPPKWWHFVESLSISFSVSFWWT